LAESILRKVSPANQRIGFSSDVLDLFLRHSWPGNVRQLTNVIRTALALGAGESEITVEHLPEDFLEQIGVHTEEFRNRAEPEPGSGSGRLDEMEDLAIRDVLNECKGNVSAAARKLGVSRSTLYRKSKGNSDPFL
jgi:transcriptional regulator of acetoin/glycerol metabolism